MVRALWKTQILSPFGHKNANIITPWSQKRKYYHPLVAKTQILSPPGHQNG